jgi:hypothetical protein
MEQDGIWTCTRCGKPQIDKAHEVKATRPHMIITCYGYWPEEPDEWHDLMEIMEP